MIAQEGEVVTADPAAAEGIVAWFLIWLPACLSLDVAGYAWEGMLHEESVEFDLSQSFIVGFR